MSSVQTRGTTKARTCELLMLDSTHWQLPTRPDLCSSRLIILLSPHTSIVVVVAAKHLVSLSLSLARALLSASVCARARARGRSCDSVSLCLCLSLSQLSGWKTNTSRLLASFCSTGQPHERSSTHPLQLAASMSLSYLATHFCSH